MSLENVIPVARAGQAALDLVMRIVSERYNQDMIEALELEADPGGLLYTPDGLYMPPVDRWWRQAAPTRAQLESPPAHVAGFVGPVGATIYPSDFQGLTGFGAVATALLPFGVTLMIRHAPQRAVADPHQPGKKLTQEEILLMRCLAYQGALKHTLTKWGCQDVACRDINPVEDIGIAGDIGSYTPEDANTLRGIIYVEFNIYQFQGFPLQQRLPTP